MKHDLSLESFLIKEKKDNKNMYKNNHSFYDQLMQELEVRKSSFFRSIFPMKLTVK